MANSMTDVPLELELACPVCKEFFREPMLLPCEHSICRSCLESSIAVGRKTCPLCRKAFEEDQPRKERTFHMVSESYQRHRHLWAEHRPSEESCRLHLKPLELFCRNDEVPVCVDCSSLHSRHELLPLKDGAQECKKELGFIVKILESRMVAHKKLAYDLDCAGKFIKDQVEMVESQIKAEFERIHEILREEEASRLQALAHEEAQKRAAIDDLIVSTKKDVEALNKLINNLKKEMGNEDLPLTRNFQGLKRGSEWTGNDCTFPDGSLIDVHKHLGALSYKVWLAMKTHVKYYPVLLDPNTTSPWLCLSPDLTTVNESPERLTVPDNSERFEPCVFLLGAEGYTSGKHKWDVIVGDHPKWMVGVCKKSVPRKKKFTVCTTRGVWSLAFSKGVYTVLTPERTELKLQKRPERIRVRLNMDKGEVSFWDGDTQEHLITLTAQFNERIFPIFGPGLQSQPMMLAPGKIAVHTS
ncbi:tripartite motif containing 35-28 [Synchiropus splendidus]|uniref:tripartite motif containing 35-28 n=1 Tax=Synchiropus splendidus TaxID=270530 RepID=UPI00237D4E3A|nr:tripartite motif containing 35-28 [Synchiropus splendidus]XP_053737128.1 tripartite motif containing 35-28 [Synchiropus splendidus]